jgi:hypothetical protein
MLVLFCYSMWTNDFLVENQISYDRLVGTAFKYKNKTLINSFGSHQILVISYLCSGSARIRYFWFPDRDP